MEVHYIGSYQMHPVRSSCLGLSAKGLMVRQIHEDFCLAFSKQEFRMAPPKLHGRVHIGLPELHGRIRIGLPELHRRFHIDPTKWVIQFLIVPLNLVLLDFHSRGFLWYHGYYARKAKKKRV